MSIIEIDDLKANYKVRDTWNKTINDVEAVDHISIQIQKGEAIGITGESGCGKSTLAKMMYGLVKPPLTLINGSVRYNINQQQIDILKLDKETLRKIWWDVISYIPQGSMNVLNPTSRIKDSFTDVLKAHKKEISGKNAEELIFKHLSNVGLSLEVAKCYPHQLSGGMKQRVVIALATLLNPQIILADEPTTALDVIVQRGILQSIAKTQEELKCTLIVVSHDLGVHAQIAQRLVIMYAGKIVEMGSASDVFKKPLHPYTRFLLSSISKIGEKSKKNNLCVVPPSLVNPPKGCRFHTRCPCAKGNCEKNEPPLIEIESGHYVACHNDEVK